MGDELIHHAIQPSLIPGWAESAPDSVKKILERSSGELQYYPGECAVLGASALVHLEYGGEKHAARIAAHLQSEAPGDPEE